LPNGTLLRIFPVVATVENRDDEDHSYSITWEADKQYWFDIVYDIAKDMDSKSRQVYMVDSEGGTDTLVIPRDANFTQVRDLWKRLLEVPYDAEIQMRSPNGEEFYWCLESSKDVKAYTFRAVDLHGDVRIFEGFSGFEADQISRILGIKMPPLSQCRSSPCRNLGPVIQYDAGVAPLGLRILREHALVWNLGGRILRAPQVTTWWLPYNLEAIMRYGHSVNTEIPEDPNEAEFPPIPWANEVTIRIKSHAAPKAPAAPLPANGSQEPPVPGLPSGWRGPALGQAPLISPAASALDSYNSPYSARTVEGQQEEPPDEDLQVFRGLSQKDEIVHKMISWTTLESFPLRVGISLQIQSPVNEEFHEVQLWEQTDTDQWIVEENHAAFVYSWLFERFTLRSTARAPPKGMPNSVQEVSVQTRRDGKFGYILFTPENSLASSTKEMDLQLMIEYEEGYMKVGMGEAYTIRMLVNEFWELTHKCNLGH
jgi:hypothetical protein